MPRKTAQTGLVYELGNFTDSQDKAGPDLWKSTIAPGGVSGKESICQCRRLKKCGFDPWDGKIPWRKEMAAHSSILAWKIPMDRGVWQATVHGIAQSQTRLNNWTCLKMWRVWWGGVWALRKAWFSVSLCLYRWGHWTMERLSELLRSHRWGYNRLGWKIL